MKYLGYSSVFLSLILIIVFTIPPDFGRYSKGEMSHFGLGMDKSDLTSQLGNPYWTSTSIEGTTKTEVLYYYTVSDSSYHTITFTFEDGKLRTFK